MRRCRQALSLCEPRSRCSACSPAASVAARVQAISAAGHPQGCRTAHRSSGRGASRRLGGGDGRARRPAARMLARPPPREGAPRACDRREGRRRRAACRPAFRLSGRDARGTDCRPCLVHVACGSAARQSHRFNPRRGSSRRGQPTTRAAARSARAPEAAPRGGAARPIPCCHAGTWCRARTAPQSARAQLSAAR